jgi:uncharacterized protein YbjT (DUF2867 family)
LYIKSTDICRIISHHIHKMKILVYGAAGSQQFPVIDALKKKGAIVVATTHSEGNISKLEAAGAQVAVADMADDRRLEEINLGIDAVALLVPFFVADPADGFRYAQNAIDAAKTQGVKWIVWNSSGFIVPYRTGNPALDIRLDIQEYLQNSGIPHLIIQPSVYAENLLGPWTAPFVQQDGLLAYPTPEAMPIGWVATQDVAALVAEALFTPQYAGQSWQVSGLENLNGTELAACFSMALGKQIEYYPMPPQEFGRILDGLWGAGAGDAAAGFYQQIHDTEQFPVLFSAEMPDILSKVPVSMTDMTAWVTQHQSFFKY